jgi:hypothetical protein
LGHLNAIKQLAIYDLKTRQGLNIVATNLLGGGGFSQAFSGCN